MHKSTDKFLIVWLLLIVFIALVFIDSGSSKRRRPLRRFLRRCKKLERRYNICAVKDSPVPKYNHKCSKIFGKRKKKRRMCSRCRRKVNKCKISKTVFLSPFAIHVNLLPTTPQNKTQTSN